MGFAPCSRMGGCSGFVSGRRGGQRALGRRAFRLWGFLNYHLYLAYPGKDWVACQLLSLAELGGEELDGTPVQLWPDDEMGFFCYFPDSMRLLRLTAAPAA